MHGSPLATSRLLSGKVPSQRFFSNNLCPLVHIMCTATNSGVLTLWPWLNGNMYIITILFTHVITEVFLYNFHVNA